MASIRKTWRDSGAGLQGLIIVSWYLGVTVFGVGIIGDWLRWWQSLNFIPNVLTAISGFFIGAPVALVFLSALEAQREERKQKDLSNAAWREFASRVTSFCTEDQINALQTLCQCIADKWQEIYVGLTYLEAMKFISVHDDEILNAHYKAMAAHYEEVHTLLRTWASELEEMLIALAKIMPRGDELAIEWAGIQASWAMLETYVKTQRFELQLDPLWLSSGVDSRIRQKIVLQKNPLDTFSAQNDPRTDYPESGGMRNVPAFLRKCADNFEASQLRHTLVMQSNSALYCMQTGNYSELAWSASHALEELKNDIRSAEVENGWPPLAP